MTSRHGEESRLSMVEGQLRNRGISSESVLDAMASVPRELFVPLYIAHQAYEDRALSIGQGQTISQPWIVAYPAHAPYDAIMVTAASPRIPGPLVDQLRIGGRLILPLESEWYETLVLVRKKENGYDTTRLCECRFVPLIGEHGYPAGEAP